MPSLADNLLASGAASHIEAVHGERVVVETGPDASSSYTAVVETDPDAVMEAQIAGTNDRRARRVIRFTRTVPRLAPNFVIRTSDGRRWSLTDNPQSSYLSNDYHVVELTAKDAQ